MTPHKFPAGGKERLTDAQRRHFQPAEEIVSRMSPARSEVCVDLGSGPGYIALPLSSKVKCAIAMDVQKEMLQSLTTRAGEAIGRIEPVLAEMPWIPVKTSSVDRVIMVNVVHEIEDKAELAREIDRVLKKGGHLSIVDFPKAATSFGPPVEERLSAEEIMATFPDMRLIDRWDFPEFYQLEFKKEVT